MTNHSTMEFLDEDIDLTMLVDDNETDNYLTEHAIKKANFSRRIKIYESGLEALAYLSDNQHNPENIPAIIFLDINMLDMDAFAFVRAFEKLSWMVKDKCRFIILSSTDDPEVISKIAKNKYVINLIQKPVDKSVLDSLKEGSSYSEVTSMKLN